MLLAWTLRDPFTRPLFCFAPRMLRVRYFAPLGAFVCYGLHPLIATVSLFGITWAFMADRRVSRTGVEDPPVENQAQMWS